MAAMAAKMTVNKATNKSPDGTKVKSKASLGTIPKVRPVRISKILKSQKPQNRESQRFRPIREYSLQ